MQLIIYKVVKEIDKMSSALPVLSRLAGLEIIPINDKK